MVVSWIWLIIGFLLGGISFIVFFFFCALVIGINAEEKARIRHDEQSVAARIKWDAEHKDAEHKKKDTKK